MKNVILIAFLLLGVVGCIKTENTPGLRTEQIKAPPMNWKLWCAECGHKNSVSPYMCTVEKIYGTPDEDDPIPMTGERYGLFCRPKVYIQALYDTSLINQINEDHEGTTLDPDLAFTLPQTFSDDWLWGFSEGTEYVNYYRFISYVAFSDGIPLADIPAHYAFARATYIVADSLQNGSMSCVPITSGYKADAEDMIDYYRLKTDWPQFETALDSIQADLNRHVGKTKQQIYDFYESQ